MPIAPSRTWTIVLVVVRDEDRYCLVNETRGRGWFLPAGRVDVGETLVQGARREVREEAGLDVELDGIIRIEHTPADTPGSWARLRVVFTAHLVGGQLKTEPDDESLGAAWATLHDLERYDLRSPEVHHHIRYVDQGGLVAPISMVTFEGAPYPR